MQNAQEYYAEAKKLEIELERTHMTDNGIYITSVRHREKNSFPGSTVTATPKLAALRITDGTHRLATEQEIQDFIKLQQDNLRKNQQSEQERKKTMIVVMPPAQVPGSETVAEAMGAQQRREAVKKSNKENTEQ